MSRLAQKLTTTIIFTLAVFFAGCDMPVSQPAAGGPSVKIVTPVNGAQLNVGDLVDVGSRVSDPGGASKFFLIVNSQPAREDKLNMPLRNGKMNQPWRPSVPGTYTLQVIMVTSSGANLQSDAITVYVGGEAQPLEDDLSTPNVMETVITPIPSETITPTPTPTESTTPTPTLGPPMATADNDANCRFGPGSVYDVIGTLLQGQSAPIVGRNTYSSWWVIEHVGSAGTCWIWDGTVSISGDTSDVPVVVPPPTPTPSPTITPTTAPLTAPDQVSPIGVIGCSDALMDVALQWTQPSGDVAGYQWVVQKAYSASGPWDEQVGAGETASLSQTVNIQCGSAFYYRWRVRAVDNQGNAGPWSGWAEFQAPL